LLLGAAYLATRTLWLPIGVHFAWNLVESGFGTAVSGKSSEFGSLVHSTLLGPSSLTGGSFGPEAGWAAILSCLVASALMLGYAKRHGRIVPRRDTARPHASLG
jgi:membrane protease YdiL (CAAX protease family)